MGTRKKSKLQITFFPITCLQTLFTFILPSFLPKKKIPISSNFPVLFPLQYWQFYSKKSQCQALRRKTSQSISHPQKVTSKEKVAKYLVINAST